ncbi:MAG: ABC transporter substrate-binding protein [Clostridia bacterium]
MRKNKLSVLILVLVIALSCTLCGFSSCNGTGEIGETKTITTLNGKQIEIPVSPQRIVALTNVGDLLAMGITPVAGANQFINENLGFSASGVAVLKNTQPFDAEEILSYTPDLIIVYQDMSIENIATLEAIAPVVPIKSNSLDCSVRLAYIGELFNLQDKAIEVIGHVDTVISKAIARFKTLNVEGKTVTVFNYFSGLEIIVSDMFAFNSIIYKTFKMRAPQKVEDEIFGHDGMFAISSELMGDYIGDYIFTLMDPLPSDLTELPIWKALKPVKAGAVGYLDMELYLQKDALYVEKQYDVILDLLEAAFGVKA